MVHDVFVVVVPREELLGVAAAWPARVREALQEGSIWSVRVAHGGAISAEKLEAVKLLHVRLQWQMFGDFPEMVEFAASRDVSVDVFERCWRLRVVRTMLPLHDEIEEAMAEEPEIFRAGSSQLKSYLTRKYSYKP